jgi:hypothetical protein
VIAYLERFNQSLFSILQSVPWQMLLKYLNFSFDFSSEIKILRRLVKTSTQKLIKLDYVINLILDAE